MLEEVSPSYTRAISFSVANSGGVSPTVNTSFIISFAVPKWALRVVPLVLAKKTKKQKQQKPHTKTYSLEKNIFHANQQHNNRGDTLTTHE